MARMNRIDDPQTHSWLRRVFKIFLIVILSLLLLSLLIQIPFIQNKLKGGIRSVITDAVHKPVTIGHFKLAWLSRLQVDDFSIRSDRGDTLLQVVHLSTSLKNGLFSLLKGKLDLPDIRLEGFKVHDFVNEADSVSGWSEIVKDLFGNKDTTVQAAKKPLLINLKDISLSDLSYHKENSFVKWNLSLQKASIGIDKIDLPNHTLWVHHVIFDRPDFDLTNKKPSNDKVFIDYHLDSAWNIKLDQMAVRDGILRINDNKINSPLEFLKKAIRGVELEIRQAQLTDGILRIHLPKVRAINDDSIGLKNLSAHLILDNHNFTLTGVDLSTGYSHLEDSLHFYYSSPKDLNQFADKVKLNLNLQKSHIALKDIAAFVPALNNSVFYKKYSGEKVNLNGHFFGTLNNLKSNHSNIKIGSLVEYDGKIEISDILDPKNAFVSLRINRLETTASVLRQLIGLEKLTNMDKLGTINYRGNVDGSIRDIVLYGTLYTALGKSKMDMRLDTKEGTEKAKYSGHIELTDFDLAKWSSDNHWGKISIVADLENGSSLYAATASATMKSMIQNLEYNGYSYNNITFNGKLNRKLIDGNLSLKDPNADFDFKGKIDLTNSVPSYQFTSDIRKLNFNKLHLTNDTLELNGRLDIDAKGDNLDDLDGVIRAENIHILRDTNSVFLDAMKLTSSKYVNGRHEIKLQSDWADAYFDGIYKLKYVMPALERQFASQFPEIAQTLHLNEDIKIEDSTYKQQFKFDLAVRDVKPLNVLAKVPVTAKVPFKIEGEVNQTKKYLLAKWNIPDLQVKDFSVYRSVGRLEAFGSSGLITSYIDSTFSSNFQMPYSVLVADLDRNKLNFSIKTPRVADVVNNVDLNGSVQLIDSTFHLHFNSSQVSFMDKSWDILPDNDVAFRKGYLHTRNIQFVHDKEKIEVTSIGDKGLHATISDLDIHWFNRIMPLKEWVISGKINLKADVDDIYSLQGLKVAGLIDSLFINRSYFGLMDLNAYTPNVDQPIRISAAMLESSRQMLADGFYDISGKYSGVKNNFDFKMIFKDYPLRLFEYLIDDVIDNTRGNIRGNFEIKKDHDLTDFSGKINITDGGFKVNYLNTNYTIGNETVLITNSKIDASGVKIYDEFKNPATLTGGILHQRLKNFSLDATLQGNRFLVLKTSKENNPDYYGTLVGQVLAKFHGPFNQIDIDVKGSTQRPSNLSIPVSQATVIAKDRVVEFRPKTSNISKDSILAKRASKIRGLAVAIDMSLNPDADVSIIFDEKRGDIIQGNGNGNMQMRFERSGDINMYGNYEVEQGKYLFTLYGVVNKPFTIRQGGTIRWEGNPLGAIIDLDADYKGVSSPLVNLLPEYEGVIPATELRTKNQIDLGMHLSGQLFKPEIAFSLQIPNISGNLRTIVDNKLALLKADQNSLNQQVAGLMLWGSFLPPNQIVSSFQSGFFNNVSQFISNQVSILVENALRELASDGVISGWNFDANYYLNNQSADQSNFNIYNELNLSLGPKFFEDKLSVNVGAKFSNTTQYDKLITPHFEVEYSITDDRRLKIRAYVRKDELSQGQLKDRFGGGISWRKEFDNIEDFKKVNN